MKKETDFPIRTSPLRSHRGLTRREVLQRALATLGAVLAAPLSQAHPMYRHLADPTHLEAADEKVGTADWKPEFLNSMQNEALIAIAERMMPGSAKAQVNRVIDLLLTVETAENRQKFTAALGALDAESTKRFSRPIPHLSAAQLDELLSTCSALVPMHPPENDDSPASLKVEKTASNHPANLGDHFENLKGWIVATYYSSEQGMRELDWSDEFYFESPAECSHSEGHQ